MRHKISGNYLNVTNHIPTVITINFVLIQYASETIYLKRISTVTDEYTSRIHNVFGRKKKIAFKSVDDIIYFYQVMMCIETLGSRTITGAEEKSLMM